jgi:MFS family permease
LLGALAFCFTLAEGAGLNWSTVYVTESLRGTEVLGAVALGVFLGTVTLGRLVGDRLVSRFGAVRVFRAGAIVAGVGFGGALLVDLPAAGLIGLGLLGAGIANALPLAIGAGGNTPGETPATAAARVSTLGYLGSFVGPALVGAWRACPACPWHWGCLPCWSWQRPSGRRPSGWQDRMSSWQAIGTTSDWQPRGTWSWSATL